MYPRLRVTAVIIRDDKFLLIEEKIKSENNELFWLYPGGGVEKGETLEEAVIREVKEETNLEAKIISPIIFREVVIKEQNFHTLNFYYLVEALTDDLKLEEKANNHGWFTAEEASKLKMTPFNKEVIRFAEEKKEKITHK